MRALAKSLLVALPTVALAAALNHYVGSALLAVGLFVAIGLAAEAGNPPIDGARRILWTTP